MKKIPILLNCLILAFCLGATRSFAQLIKNDAKGRIIVELYLLDEYTVKNGKAVPTYIIEAPDETTDFETPLGGSFATVGCSFCPLSSEYSFFIPTVERINNKQTRIFFDISFKNKKSCNTNSVITVKRNQVETKGLKCSVKAKIVAYHKAENQTN